MINRTYTIIIFLLLTFVGKAQQIPVIIKGATVHIGNGKTINNAYVAFDSGKIVFVDSVMRNSYKNARIIDATGKHVYPGLFLLNTYLGLNEIDAVRSTRDYNETGEINPNVRSLIAYNTDSRVVPTAKFNGITYMQVVPQGGLVSGTSCVVKTEAMNWEDAVVNEDGIHMNWPEMNHYSKDPKEQQKHLTEQQAKLVNLLAEAKQYQFKTVNDEINLRLQAMQGLFTQNKVLYVHANSAKGILEAIQFIKQHQPIKATLVTGSDAHLVADEIKQSNIPVIVNLIHSLPNRNHHDVDQPFKTVAQLVNKGIIVSIGFSGSWESRNVMYTAGTCAAHGINPEQALQLITENAAKITGNQNQAGTIEVGKNATLLISDGDILDMKESTLTHAFINGEECNLENTQTELYKKYSKRYGIEAK
ncbi:MAG: amidohydrolase family protein [Bacteroidia bacterium]